MEIHLSAAQLNQMYSHLPGVLFTEKNKANLLSNITGKSWVVTLQPVEQQATQRLFTGWEYHPPTSGDGSPTSIKEDTIREIWSQRPQPTKPSAIWNGLSVSTTPESNAHTPTEDPDALAPPCFLQGLESLLSINETCMDDPKELLLAERLMLGLGRTKACLSNVFSSSTHNESLILFDQAMSIATRSDFTLNLYAPSKKEKTFFPEDIARTIIDALEQASSWISDFEPSMKASFKNKVIGILGTLSESLDPNHPFVFALNEDELSELDINDIFAFKKTLPAIDYGNKSPVDHLPGGVFSLYHLPLTPRFALLPENNDEWDSLSNYIEKMQEGNTADYLFPVIAAVLACSSPSLSNQKGSDLRKFVQIIEEHQPQIHAGYISFMVRATRPPLIPFLGETITEKYGKNVLALPPHTSTAWSSSLLYFLEETKRSLKKAEEAESTENPRNLIHLLILTRSLTPSFSVFPEIVKREFNNLSRMIFKAVSEAYLNSKKDDVQQAWNVFAQECRIFAVLQQKQICQIAINYLYDQFTRFEQKIYKTPAAYTESSTTTKKENETQYRSYLEKITQASTRN